MLALTIISQKSVTCTFLTDENNYNDVKSDLP